MTKMLPFNKWSQERIAQGRKTCTTRTKKYNDPRVTSIIKCKLGYVKDRFWHAEGADSPEEFEQVWRDIHKQWGAKEGVFKPDQIVYVHFGDFREV